MEFSISPLTHPPHPPKMEKKIKFSPSKKGFPAHWEQLLFLPLKMSKILRKILPAILTMPTKAVQHPPWTNHPNKLLIREVINKKG